MTPVDKHDVGTAKAIVTAGDAGDPRLLDWVADLNWPVAQTLVPFLASAGRIVAPGIREVLASDDDTWKWSVVTGIIARSPELVMLLRPELERMVKVPSQGERDEGLDQVASELLDRI
ncbi:DUF5071 domain-containing protein [Massilia sp. PAMC28688]|uniref:DUF5071 domain-containing protein n=1 Tax=Massilia sp. PAMC28688 TaxID=2861283 RepID=UPI001C62523A|nr:DUF5071 domain-containing protein [Massilia sp. PAMC28688]QYF91807.1 DUF5071 domain-containing protein [Massilia sp. PAMC28688]